MSFFKSIKPRVGFILIYFWCHSRFEFPIIAVINSKYTLIFISPYKQCVRSVNSMEGMGFEPMPASHGYIYFDLAMIDLALAIIDISIWPIIG
jgi:hypothetical protein